MSDIELKVLKAQMFSKRHRCWIGLSSQHKIFNKFMNFLIRYTKQERSGFAGWVFSRKIIENCSKRLKFICGEINLRHYYLQTCKLNLQLLEKKTASNYKNFGLKLFKLFSWLFLDFSCYEHSLLHRRKQFIICFPFPVFSTLLKASEILRWSRRSQKVMFSVHIPIVNLLHNGNLFSPSHSALSPLTFMPP